MYHEAFDYFSGLNLTEEEFDTIVEEFASKIFSLFEEPIEPEIDPVF